MMDYTFDKHRHNYAIWTAARAVQRNFTTTAKIKYAINSSSLQSFVHTTSDMRPEHFESLHKLWADQIITTLLAHGVQVVTYGRAAKIISIYLKTSIILCSRAECDRSFIIHPPIDSILLKNLSELPGLSDLKSVRWTHIEKEYYWDLVERLKSYFGFFDWRIENYWTI